MEHLKVIKNNIFLSVILVVRNHSNNLRGSITNVIDTVASIVTDFEVIIVDNASEDMSVLELKQLTSADGIHNLQVFSLTKEVNYYTGAWVGLENSLGDYVAVIDPLSDDINFLPQMLDKAALGADVVFASNKEKKLENIPYRLASFVFNLLYKWLNGTHLTKEAPQYRILNRKVINFILQHPRPAMTYKHLPATGGFSKINLSYKTTPKFSSNKSFRSSIDMGMQLLVSTTRAPMRMVTTLTLFGAAANLFYSIYVIFIGLTKADIAPGWISLSLQQSGMFFLISLVLLVIGEYILHMTDLSNEAPQYHIGQEFTSTHVTRHGKLNIEEVVSESSDRFSRTEGK